MVLHLAGDRAKRVWMRLGGKKTGCVGASGSGRLGIWRKRDLMETGALICPFAAAFVYIHYKGT